MFIDQELISSQQENIIKLIKEAILIGDHELIINIFKKLIHHEYESGLIIDNVFDIGDHELILNIFKIVCCSYFDIAKNIARKIIEINDKILIYNALIKICNNFNNSEHFYLLEKELIKIGNIELILEAFKINGSSDLEYALIANGNLKLILLAFKKYQRIGFVKQIIKSGDGLLIIEAFKEVSQGCLIEGLLAEGIVNIGDGKLMIQALTIKLNNTSSTYYLNKKPKGFIESETVLINGVLNTGKQDLYLDLLEKSTVFGKNIYEILKKIIATNNRELILDAIEKVRDTPGQVHILEEWVFKNTKSDYNVTIEALIRLNGKCGPLLVKSIINSQDSNFIFNIFEITAINKNPCKHLAQGIVDLQDIDLMNKALTLVNLDTEAGKILFFELKHF